MSNLEKKSIWGKSTYYHLHNQTVNWCSGDSKETFEKHLSNSSTRKLLEQNGWLDKDITYTFNEHGYRCDSFDLPCDMLFAGCSQTMGIGLSLDVMWAPRVAEHLQIPYHSIACGGADWQHVAQKVCYWLPILKPKVLVLKPPPKERFNWWDQETVVSTCQFGEEELIDCKVNESRPLINIVEENNSTWYQYSMTHLIQQHCNKNNVKLISIPAGRLNRDGNYKSSVARDLAHFGTQEQDHTYKYTLYKIKNEKYS